MRVFVAAELPSAVKREIAETQKGLHDWGVEARWVDPDIVHLTLAFLGSITPEKAKIAGHILVEVWNQAKPLKFQFAKLDCFPNSQRAKIIFLSLEGELENLVNRAKEVRERLKAIGIYFDEKPFLVHITLGRTKKPQNLAKLLPKIKISHQEFFLKKISLIKSTLTRSGPIYQDFKTIILK